MITLGTFALLMLILTPPVALAVAVWLLFGDTIDRWLGGDDERPRQDEANAQLRLYSSHDRNVKALEHAGDRGLA